MMMDQNKRIETITKLSNQIGSFALIEYDNLNIKDAMLGVAYALSAILALAKERNRIPKDSRDYVVNLLQKIQSFTKKEIK